MECMKFCEIHGKFCLLPTPSKRHVLSLHLKISQEHILLNSHSYTDTRSVVLEVSVFSVMVFIGLSRQKRKFVCDKSTHLRKLFLFFGLILQNNNKS